MSNDDLQTPEKDRPTGRKTGDGLRRLATAGVMIAVVLLVGWRTLLPAPEIPGEAVTNNDGWADEQQCAECHTQAETFWQTGHALTLRPVSEVDSLARLQQLSASPAAQQAAVRIETRADGVYGVHDVAGVEHTVRLDWCFGSGLHAQTWVGLLGDSWGTTDLLEFRWTWFHEVDGFAVTPGQPQAVTPTYFGGLGVLYDHPKTHKCFACHASYLPSHHGRLDEQSIKPGVTCQRCHGPRQQHVDSGGEWTNSTWRSAGQMESVNRCAECHRRADEQEPAAISTGNLEIVRFQPVGLVQSPCFQGSPQMTCLTCHDPHRTLAQQDSLGIWQCTQCHGAESKQHTTCRAGHTDDCLRCHMPKVQTNDPVSFTDHWIRIRAMDEGVE